MLSYQYWKTLYLLLQERIGAFHRPICIVCFGLLVKDVFLVRAIICEVMGLGFLPLSDLL